MVQITPARQMLAARLAAAAIGYGFVLVAARALGAAEFGLVAVALQAAFLLSVVGSAGQHLALVRFLPACGAAGQRRAVLRGACRRAGLASLATVALAGALWLAARVGGWAGDFGPGWAGAMLALALVIGWADFQAHWARGAGAHLTSVLPKEVLWRGLAAGLLLALPVPGAVACLWLMAGLLAALNIAQLLRLLRRRPAPAGTGERVGPGRAGRHFWLSAVSNVFLANADVIAVGLVMGPTAGGVFFVANRLAQALAIFLTSRNLVLAPELAALAATGRMPAAAGQAARAALEMTRPTLIAGLVLILAAQPVLALFGPEFPRGAPVLGLLVAAAIANAALGPGDIVLNMCGEERLAARLAVQNLVLGGALIAGGVWLAGDIGAAAGVLAATLLRKGACWRAARRRLGMRVDALAGLTAPPAPLREAG